MQDNSQKMTKMKQLLTECENSVNCLKTTKILVSANYCYFSDGCCELLYFLHAVLSKGEKYQVPINMGEEDTLTQIQFVEPKQACFVKGEEVTCQRACKGSVAKQDSLLTNAFCVKLHICIMKMAILKKPSQKWSIVPGKPSAKLCRKQKTGVLCVFLSSPICVLDICAISPGKYACSLAWKI